MYSAVLPNNVISEAVSLRLSCFLRVQISLPYVSAGIANIAYSQSYCFLYIVWLKTVVRYAYYILKFDFFS
jgi:hypothetical protein